MTNVQGRIFFPGNPWPNGHRVASFRWGAILHPRRGLALEFELTSADYYDDDGTHIVPRDREDEELAKSDWQSKIAWNNFHACTIGPSMSSLTPGIAVSDGRAPFDFDRPAYAFTADPLPVDMATFFETNAFGIYLLGHDAVADHRIAMKRSADGSYAVDWTGRIALAYVGEHDFKYSFNARVAGVRFELDLNVLFPRQQRTRPARLEARSGREPQGSLVAVCRRSRPLRHRNAAWHTSCCQALARDGFETGFQVSKLKRPALGGARAGFRISATGGR